MKRGKAGQQVTITGIVTAADWDEDDDIVAVTISTADEEEYLVDDNPKGEELLELVYRNVKATGVVEDDGEGGKLISVRSYEILDD
ncbi:MAG: hypothetical protein AB1847_07535 [bacterium]